jgi:PEP-CTERM motif
VLTSHKSIVSALIFLALAIVPASATTVDIVSNGKILGTVTFTQAGSNVDVTINMNSGYALLTEGGDIWVLNGVSGPSSIANLSLSGMSEHAKNNPTIGGFTFTDLFQTHEKGGQDFVTTLSFVIDKANASQIKALGFHVCFSYNGVDCADTGYAETEASGGAPVPEPGTLSLLGTGLLGIAGLIHRKFVS